MSEIDTSNPPPAFANGARWIHKRTSAATRVIGVVTDTRGHYPSFSPGEQYVLCLGIEDAPHDVWELGLFKELFEYSP